MLGSPHWFFASALYEPYDLAIRLKKTGNFSYPILKKKERRVLKFYGIPDDKKSR